jgi:hypothetical protein
VHTSTNLTSPEVNDYAFSGPEVCETRTGYLQGTNLEPDQLNNTPHVK